jgi:hypothetical protein
MPPSARVSALDRPALPAAILALGLVLGGWLNRFSGERGGPRFVIQQTVIVRSRTPDVVMAASQKVSELVAGGVILSSSGDFLMLSETPTNNAVNFLTGAGSFLQQVIFGYTGLRLSDQGVKPAFAPVLPSSIKRIVLRQVKVRGKPYDVVVDSAGLHMNPR